MQKLPAYLLFSLIMAVIYISAFAGFFINRNIVLTKEAILLSLLSNLFLMGGGALLVVYLIYDGSILDAFKNLYFVKKGVGRAIFYGIAMTIFFIGIMAGIGCLFKEKNPLGEEIGSNVDLSLLILIPVVSSISEETFFRGLIQMQMEKKVNYIIAIVISSILFSLAHIEYGVFIEIIATFLFSLLLGYIMHVTKNIIAPITAHFMYNFLVLLTFLYK